jgi:hypothetical protein
MACWRCAAVGRLLHRDALGWLPVNTGVSLWLHDVWGQVGGSYFLAGDEAMLRLNYPFPF